MVAALPCEEVPSSEDINPNDIDHFAFDALPGASGSRFDWCPNGYFEELIQANSEITLEIVKELIAEKTEVTQEEMR